MKAAVSRIKPDHPDFAELVRLLDNEFYAMYGDVYLSYQSHNTLTELEAAMIVYADGAPAACGGIKPFDAHTAELKRIFVRPDFRRLGLAQRLIHDLEAAALEQGYDHMALVTGADMPAAISLYQKLGYAVASSYGPYAGDDACVCMTKTLGNTIA